MTIQAKKSPMQMAGEIAKVIELDSIATREWSAKFETPEAQPPALPGQVRLNFKHVVRFFLNRTAKILDLEVEVLVDGKDKTEKEVITIKTDLVLRYHFPGDVPDVSEEHFKHFAELNGVMNAWPYARELVQSSTARMGLPQLVMPLLKGSSLMPAKKSLEKPEAQRE